MGTLNIRRTVVILMWTAALAALVAFFDEVQTTLAGIPWAVMLSPRGLVAVAVATAIYLMAMVAGGLAWYSLLRRPGDQPRAWTAVTVALTAQFAKYLPGNLAQLVGLVELDSHHGFDPRRSVASTAIEIPL